MKLSDVVEDLGAAAENIDPGPVVTLDEIIDAVALLKAWLTEKSGRAVDTGIGYGGGDLWVTINDVEYLLSMKAKQRIGLQ